MLNWVNVWTPSWPVHDLNILLVQKGCRVTCCMGRGIVLGVHKVTSKHPHRPWQHLIPQDLDVPMPVHGSIQHNQLTPPPWWIAPHTMTDGPRFPSLDWMQASISLSPCLRRTRTRPSMWYRENRDSSLKIQCLHCLRSHTLCLLPHSRWHRLCSKVSLGHLAGRREQYPVARSRLRMVQYDIRLPKSADHLHSQTRSWDEAVCSDHSEQLTVFPWRGDFHRTSMLPLMWSASLSVASQNFAYAPLRHPQHPGYFSLRIAICRQPDNSVQYLLW